MIFELQRDSHIPLYAQIVAEVREMVASGALKAGDRLPANRELARSLGVNRSTVTTAYSELAADGLVTSHIGSGTYVSDVSALSRATAHKEQAPPSVMHWDALLANQARNDWLEEVYPRHQDKEVISLAYALPPAELFPLDEFRHSVDRVLRKQGRVLLQLGATSGYRPLQEYLASQMAISGMAVSADEILITNGCQQSLDLIRQILLDGGDEVFIENPTYPGAISVFCGGQARFTSVPVGENGIDLNVLEDFLSQRRPKLIYTVPSFHNPTGVTMDLKARRQLIALAGKYRVPIVEDDIYHELYYDGAQLPTLKALDTQGLVIYINSFSKVGFPGLRIGWIAAPRVVVESLNRAKQRADLHASLLTQAAIHEFSKHGLLLKHIKRVRKAYAARRDVMLESLEKYFPAETSWSRPEGGMAIWVRLPESLNASQLIHQAVESGVVFIPGNHFYSSSHRQNMMRLSFTIAGPAMIEEAIKRLGAIIKGRLSKAKRQRDLHRPDAVRAIV